MRLYSAERVDPETLRALLHQAVELAKSLNVKAARLFALGLESGDDYKRFLYFFLALEVETNAVFKRIDHEAAFAGLLGISNVSQATTQLLAHRTAGFTNLADKFVWCVVCGVCLARAL